MELNLEDILVTGIEENMRGQSTPMNIFERGTRSVRLIFVRKRKMNVRK